MTTEEPKTLIDRLHALALWVLLALAAFGLGALQGWAQCERTWRGSIKDCATLEQGIPTPIYEDAMGNVYYVCRDTRRVAMVGPRGH